MVTLEGSTKVIAASEQKAIELKQPTKAATVFPISAWMVTVTEAGAEHSGFFTGANIYGNNRGVVYVGAGKVEVRPIDFPKLSLGSRKCEHGVILKVVSTNICGSDQHMV